MKGKLTILVVLVLVLALVVSFTITPPDISYPPLSPTKSGDVIFYEGYYFRANEDLSWGMLSPAEATHSPDVFELRRLI